MKKKQTKQTKKKKKKEKKKCFETGSFPQLLLKLEIL